MTNVSDNGPGSLRQAIIDANNRPGRDRIVFAIPGDGPHSLRPLTELPSITAPVVIDGYTQPGARPNTAEVGTNAVLKIELDGSLAADQAGSSFGSNGLTILAPRSVVRGFIINRFEDSGIRIEPDANRSVVERSCTSIRSGSSTSGAITTASTCSCSQM